MNKKTIGFVLPIYNEEKNIRILYKELIDEINEIWCNYEMLFINDGSQDNSLSELKEIKARDKNVKIIDLSRNFGHEQAVKAWLDHCHGDYIVIMDTDLQDPPKLIKEMYKKITQGYDIVYAQRETRNDGWFKDTTAKIFYKILQKVTETEIPANTGNYRMFTNQVKQEIKNLNEQWRFIRWLFARVWFKNAVVKFERPKRKHWKTSYPIKKMLRLSIDAMLGFSSLPLKIATFTGVIIGLIGFLLGCYFIRIKIYVDPVRYAAWTTTIITLMLIMFWLIFFFLWIIGEYVAKIFAQSKNRPLYIIKDFHQ